MKTFESSRVRQNAGAFARVLANAATEIYRGYHAFFDNGIIR